MRIGIMGSGGLGGYFGARLALGGADVRFIARGRHLEAMRRDGLRIEGPEPLHVRKVQATDSPAEAGVVDVVMLGVKLWDTEQAIAQMRPMVGPDTAIISFQNGVLKEGHPEYIGSLPIGDLDVQASPAGSKVATQLIWDTMVEHCIAQ